MNYLLLVPEGPEADFVDVSYPRLFGMGGANVCRLDPEAAYCRGGMAGLEREVLALSRERDIQVLVYALGAEFDFRPEFFVRDLPRVFKVLLLGDDGQYFDVSHRYYSECFDLVLTTNPPLCDHYALFGTEAWVLPSTYDARTCRPENPKTKEIDVSFVGLMFGKEGRDEYARALAGAGVDFKLYGPGSPAGLVSPEKMLEVFRRSRINLNFTRGGLTPLDRHLSINRRIRLVKGRSAKIALCGSFVLSEYAPGLERLFEIGTEIDVFNNESELLEKTRHYLAHPDQREEMAAKAHARALRDYDEAKFWPHFVEAIDARASDRRARAVLPYGFDTTFWSRFGAWRFKYLVVFLLQANLRLLFAELLLLLKTARVVPSVALWAGGLGLNTAARTSSIAAWLNRGKRRLRRAR